MNILYDLRYASDHFPGIGTHATRLMEHLLALAGPERWTVLWNPLRAAGRFDLSPLGAHPHVEWRETTCPALGPRTAFCTGAELRRLRPDVYLSPYSLQPVAPGTPCVLTLHDVLPLRVSGAVPPLRRLMFSVAMWHARRAAAVLTSSDFSRAEILAATSLSPERVRVVRPGVPNDPVHAVTRRPAALPDGPFALTVGINKPHKNLQTLAMAWTFLGRNAPLRLVHAGPRDSRYPSLAAPAAEARVLALGWVDEEELAWLYRNATLLVFPSLYEGFGFPVLEAMAAGLPALVADIPPLRELGGDAVRYLPPRDPAAWAEAVKTLTGDAAGRARLAAAGRKQAAAFKYSRTATQVLDVVREVARIGNARPTRGG